MAAVVFFFWATTTRECFEVTLTPKEQARLLQVSGRNKTPYCMCPKIIIRLASYKRVQRSGKIVRSLCRRDGSSRM